ncbi:TetR/AcrR family transcriptional regulator [Antrihabitans cavernicola]|uniref:TetR/AcrR family transcriptional regulator n=1 Tax=Antrihabitans cavernicola TaxID=2495913 RepID=A0A5A7SHZ2_9NOCA|nr:TetR/AcrR family transcriptional regulator [Spelaeibacter cavernicola]KAA0024792.1 TetR/AcrR family transcriptional regulator [Spelaeibacter cavernicola]
MHSNGPRERLLLSAITLMCERGVHATGVADLLAHSHTARGSIYQHFSGGKSELMEQATYSAGRSIDAVLDELLATRNPTSAVDGIIDYWKQVLVGSNYTMGCPILAAAQAGPQEPAVQAASATVFGSWVDKIAGAMESVGVDPATAKPIASMAISAIEGAIAQSRSSYSTQPLDDVRTGLTRLIDSAVSATDKP